MNRDKAPLLDATGVELPSKPPRCETIYQVAAYGRNGWWSVHPSGAGSYCIEETARRAAAELGNYWSHICIVKIVLPTAKERAMKYNVTVLWSKYQEKVFTVNADNEDEAKVRAIKAATADVDAGAPDCDWTDLGQDFDVFAPVTKEN